MSKLKKNTLRISVALVLFAAVMVAFKLTPLKDFEGYAKRWDFNAPQLYAYVIPFLAVYLLAGYDVLFKAVRNIFHGKVFDEHFLMTVATVGAIALCDFPEAVAVMLFYQVGELFQSYAVGRARKSISDLMDISPDTARVLRDGEEVEISPDEVAVGDTVVVRAGERVPVDGTVIEGNGSMDVCSLTGESVPREFSAGDAVLSGGINLTGSVKIRADREYYDSTVAKILDLVENASARKARSESFITKFARYYTPAVVFTALALAVIPPLFIGEWAIWIERALTFLVVSCPCALVISVPLSFFGGIGGASKRGILVKGGSYMEALAKVRTFAFDKTGTLTKGRFEVSGVYPEENRAEALRIAAIAESASNHPIAQSVIRYTGRPDTAGFTFKEIAGRGVVATGNGEEILAGSLALLSEQGVEVKVKDFSESAVYLAKNGSFIGYITVEDALKDNARDVIAELKYKGSKTVMLTGDSPSVAKKIADGLGVDGYRAGLLPQDKVGEVEALIGQSGGKVCFVGDGINDAPVLSVADVGISMGGIGSDAAIEASDVVLMHDDLSAIPEAVRISKKTMRIVIENIVFALGIKIGVLVLSAFGLANMWHAVFADVGVAIIAILNAMRTLKVK